MQSECHYPLSYNPLNVDERRWRRSAVGLSLLPQAAPPSAGGFAAASAGGNHGLELVLSAWGCPAARPLGGRLATALCVRRYVATSPCREGSGGSMTRTRVERLKHGHA
jgi:hypothetical protein